MKKFKEIYKLYVNRTMLAMTALGFASGFPFLLVFSTLSLWLKEAGWTYAAIGAFSLVKIPYAFKWLWAPFLDRFNLPVLSRLGRRRSWAVLMQICVFVSVVLMALIDPAKQPRLMWYAAVAVCLSSASLDIVLDAYRVETFQKRPEDQAAGSAVFVLGYRLGLIFSGAGALGLASYTNWHNVYMIMACGSVIGLITLLCVHEPNGDSKQSVQNIRNENTATRVKNFLTLAVKEPFQDFIRHKHWPLIIFLIFIYRMSDAYIAPMSFPFYDDMGFSKIEIAFIIKIYGMAAAIVGGLFGGLLVKKYGLYKGLYLCGWTQGLTTLMFAVQALLGHNVLWLTTSIILENFSSGMATTALVGYISSLCSLKYTATQYALLSSVMSFARDVFAATSGILAEYVSWSIFFVIAALFSLPGILAVVCLKRYEKNKNDLSNG
jgi:PAT family beta-lactamase induction signal transducer AmpG